jgi:hypothetical protein
MRHSRRLSSGGATNAIIGDPGCAPVATDDQKPAGSKRNRQNQCWQADSDAHLIRTLPTQ